MGGYRGGNSSCKTPSHDLPSKAYTSSRNTYTYTSSRFTFTYTYTSSRYKYIYVAIHTACVCAACVCVCVCVLSVRVAIHLYIRIYQAYIYCIYLCILAQMSCLLATHCHFRTSKHGHDRVLLGCHGFPGPELMTFRTHHSTTDDPSERCLRVHHRSPVPQVSISRLPQVLQSLCSRSCAQHPPITSHFESSLYNQQCGTGHKRLAPNLCRRKPIVGFFLRVPVRRPTTQREQTMRQLTSLLGKSHPVRGDVKGDLEFHL